MNRVVLADSRIRAEILAVEDARREALLSVDLDTLDALYDESLIHIHAPGVMHTKAQLLEHVATRQAYLDMTRSDLVVRIIGEVAVMTGRIVNRLRTADGGERMLGGAVTQVLSRGEDGRWRFLSFQMTPDGEQAWGSLPSERGQQKATITDQGGNS
ncbi:nuclear transport factor 2 family protein [Arthrobacter sp. zg-Y826]|uniref:YybH family protein n=1 Tax=Arthrobacter jinronghuae TaxID=2964609 RepID=UPI002107A6E9|nr:nuclear transport factor 2 family protein [Arthrobacter jinronghuae]MCQ1956171.1 nuclear transport factor 2 family protein [Arthrobacter jinronghuae]